MYTSTYPIVPEEPVTLKLNSLLVESKDSPDRVEFEVTEKTLCSSKGVTAKLIIVLLCIDEHCSGLFVSNYPSCLIDALIEKSFKYISS